MQNERVNFFCKKFNNYIQKVYVTQRKFTVLKTLMKGEMIVNYE